MTHPARCLIGHAVPGPVVGVDVGRKASFADRKLIDGTERNPGIIEFPAAYRADEIANDRGGDHEANEDIESRSDFEQQPAPRYDARVVLCDVLFLFYDVGHNSSSSLDASRAGPAWDCASKRGTLLHR